MQIQSDVPNVWPILIDNRFNEKIKSMPIRNRDRAAWLYSNIDYEPTPISSTLLQRIFGTRDKTLSMLIKSGDIRKTANYSTASHSCNRYSKTVRCQKSVSYIIQDLKLINKLDRWKDDRIRQISNLGTRWIVECLELIDPPLESWLRGSCRKINWNINHSTGRLSHTFANLKKEERAKMYIDCDNATEFDIVSSHLKSIACLFARDEERKRLMQPHIYENFSDSAKIDKRHIIEWNYKHPKDQIKTAKHWLIKNLNSQPNEDLAVVRKFGEEFPACFARINAYKKKAGTRKFANKLQTFEAELISLIALKLRVLRIPCISVFDSIIVPTPAKKSALEAIISSMNEQFGGFEPHYIKGNS